MTTPTDILTTIDNIEADLAAAKADLALLTRLKNAEADVKRLTSALTKAHDELAEAMTREVQGRLDARFANFRDITVTEIRGDKGSNVLGYAYVITLTQLANQGEGEFEQVLTFPGFKALPFEALCYLIQRHPERIPVAIRELAEDVDDAFNEYFSGMRRGFINKAVA